MREPTKQAAEGRWREILPALGVPAAMLNGKHHPCPLCGGKDRFRFTDIKKQGDYFCNQCGSGPGISLVMKLNGWDFAKAAAEVDRLLGNLPRSNGSNGHARPCASPEELNAMWRAARILSEGDPAWRYLASRGLAPEGLRSLRFLPALLHYPSKSKHPAMLARMDDSAGRPRQIQRLYLSAAGEKAKVEPPRMFMPGELPVGGAIRLGPIAPEMGVAEGIETALSASLLFGLPVWATTSAAMLERWQPPPEVAKVIVFGDSDPNYAGQAAAFALGKRLTFEAERGKLAREVRVLIPTIGEDWNDVLCRKQES